MDNDERLDLVTIDVTKVNTSKELQCIIKNELDFPVFYGMNWDAFWDAITGLVELPKKLVLIGWKNVVEKLPSDALAMEKLLTQFNQEYPALSCDIEYN